MSNANDFETEGMYKGYPIYCPSDDFTCPYLDEEGKCHIEHPPTECDDFGSYYESMENYLEEKEEN